jgi:hypothetical protein
MRSAPEPVVPTTAAAGVPEVRIRPEYPPIVDFIHSRLGSVYEALLMASFVPFLVYLC